MSYSRAVFYIDLVNGSDAARTALSGCNMTNSGGVVTVNKTAHGLVNGAVVTVPSGTYSGDWLVKRTDNDNFTLHSAPATGIIEVTGTPVANETFVIGSQTFTFKANRSGAGEVTISSDIEVQAKNIADAINTDINTVAQAFIGNYAYDEEFYRKIIIRAVAPGTAGNSLTFTESATGITVDGSGTLAGGTNSTYSADRNSVSITPVGGMSFTDAWKTEYSSPKAYAEGDVLLYAKCPNNPVSTLQSATFTNNSQIITLTTALTKTIDTAVGNTWTPSANVTAGSMTSRKYGASCQTLAIQSAFTTGKVAYKALASEQNFSGYTKISMWIGATTLFTANVFYLALCSDTTGDVVVNTLQLPTDIVSGCWMTMVVDNGSALGSSIKSVALYANSDPGTPTLYFNNIEACNAVTHQTLIGKGSTQDSDWYAIQSFAGTEIKIDSASFTASGQGYSGDSGASTLYYIQPILNLMANPAVRLERGSASGTPTNMILAIGGWNTSSNVQDGKTIILSPTQYAENCTGVFVQGYYIFVSDFTLFGANYGYKNNVRNPGIAYKCFCSNAFNYGFYSPGSIPLSSHGGLYAVNCKAYNNGSQGFYTGDYNFVYQFIALKCIARNNAYYGFGGGEYFYQCETYNNGTSGFWIYDCILDRCIISETIEITTTNRMQSWKKTIKSFNHDNTVGNHFIFYCGNFAGLGAYGTANWQTSVKHADDIGAWKIIVASSYVSPLLGNKLKIGEHLLLAGTTYTFTARIKLAHATNVGARLRCPLQYGITSEITYTKAANTDWEDVSIQVIPSVTAVIEFYVEAYYLLSTTNCTVYVGRTLLS